MRELSLLLNGASSPASRFAMTIKPVRDWNGIERLCRETNLSLHEISGMTKVPLRTLQAHVSRNMWRSVEGAPVSRAAPSTLTARRTLVRRFYKAIDTKLKQMELRMATEIAQGEETSSAADHERDTRAIGGLINQLGKISEFEADLDRPAGSRDAASAARLAEEADGYRRALAERLERLIQPAG
jgi:hypothetical protein